MSRRNFIYRSGLLLTGTALQSHATTPFRISHDWNKKANNQINIGLIGARSMGWGDLSNAIKQPNVKCIGICDVDKKVLDNRLAEVEKTYGYRPTGYSDFRALIDNKDLDAVIIGTPDHWHCLPFIYASEAGKAIYVEKPLANSIGECMVMESYTKKYKNTVQVGQQQRSGDHWISAMQYIKEGKIGQLRKVNVWGNYRYGIGLKKVPNSNPPADVDFDRWLGPAPQRSFNESRFHGAWRMFWDYGGGLITDWGVHLLDIALWAKDITQMPESVVASGGNFAFQEYDHETFDTMNVSWQIGDYIINWEQNAGLESGPYGRSYGLEFVGNDARLVIDRNGWELFPEWDPEKKQTKVPAIEKIKGNQSNHMAHMINFLECIRTNREPVCTIQHGKVVAMYAHMGNIALRTKSRLQWNDVKKNFGKNKNANDLITPEYRKPWILPRI